MTRIGISAKPLAAKQNQFAGGILLHSPTNQTRGLREAGITGKMCAAVAAIAITATAA